MKKARRKKEKKKEIVREIEEISIRKIRQRIKKEFWERKSKERRK